MKKVVFVLVIFLIVTAEGKGQRQANNDDLVTINVTKNYSSKKELILQDFMDVEYIVLETNDIFLNQGFMQDIGKKFIVITNRIGNGDIFIYDRTGKGVRKINRKGAGGEEYIDFLTQVSGEPLLSVKV